MDVNRQDNSIVITFEVKIDYKIYEEFDKLENLKMANLQLVYLDFSKTRFVTLSGSIFVIYFLNHFKQQNRYFESRVLNVSNIIAAILSKYGFFRCAKIYCNLRLESTLENINYKYLRNFDLVNVNNQSSIYWPIKTISEKSGNYFESDESGFTNSFIDYFNLIVQQGRLQPVNSSLEDVKAGFIKTIYELGKNVWEHSQSWGLAAIQSTKETKTTLAFCDYGVGFIGSYKSKNPKYERSTDGDIELIEWLLTEGNSSKAENKNGHGLTRVINFTNQVNGTLLIRTDSFEITLRGTQLRPTIVKRKFFKGTQVFINF